MDQPLKGRRVLVTDAEKRIGLYGIRYLGRAGAHVTAAAAVKGTSAPLGFRSRYTSRILELQAREADLQEHLRTHAGDYDFVTPIDIAAMVAVIDVTEAHRLPLTTLLPTRESLLTANDKERLSEYIGGTGVRYPRTILRATPERVKDLSRELSYPCVIKFRGDVRDTHWRPQDRYAIVEDAASLVSEYQRMHAVEPFPLIQEYVRGCGYGYSALYDRRHRVVAEFCHKRVREYPTSGGPSTCAESTYHPELVSLGRRLLDSLEWTGLAMVEFKFDEARGQFFVIEVNPRYWGSLPLAVASGVNFPVLHARCAMGERVEPVTQYPIGKRVRFFDKDVRSIVSLARSESGVARKARTLLSLFDPRPEEGFINLDDLGPVLSPLRSRRVRERQS